MNGDGVSYTYLSLMTGITGPFLHHDYLFRSDMQVRLDWRKKGGGLIRRNRVCQLGRWAQFHNWTKPNQAAGSFEENNSKTTIWCKPPAEKPRYEAKRG